LTETIFNWRGMGRLYFESINGTPDEGLLVALTFIFTLIYVVARFVLDILYVMLDPRVRY
jgi:peptide/nickel transport system permease protein